MKKFTLIVPYYKNFLMLQHHLTMWEGYQPEVWDRLSVVVVDDGSPERTAMEAIGKRGRNIDLRVYKILKDIPWNRNGARNLGAHVAETPWLIHIDVDHAFPPDSMAWITRFEPRPRTWYRFSRYRVGAADFTRKKDAADPNATFVKIHPHVDSYLIEKSLYWELGGYDEDYSGSLGGGSPFLYELTGSAALEQLPYDAAICVHTTHSVPDASEVHLSRDTTRYSMIRRAKKANPDQKKGPPLRFEWERVL